MLLFQERERIEKGAPIALAAIASAWAEKRIRVLMASYILVESLAQKLAHRLQVDIQSGKLNVYDTFLARERPYDVSDQADLESGHVWLVPHTVDAWLDTNNLLPTLATPSITPPVDWEVQSPHGLLKADDTEVSRLVRLADLVLWLMKTKEIPSRVAVELVCSVLSEYPSEAKNVLYLLSESDYAQPLPSGHSFAWEPIASFWDSAPPVSDTDKGVLGAVKYMREYWGESPAPGAGNRMGQEVLDPLAIRMEVAHCVWGYGSRVTTEAQPQAASPVPVLTAKAKPSTWWDVSSAYIVEVLQAGQYATAKELYRALETKAGPNVPFDKGTGPNRGSLFVRETAQPLSLKTVQNKWPKLRELAQK